MSFNAILLKDEIRISKIVSLRYFDYKDTDEEFETESNKYWEMVYVDKGQVVMEIDGKERVINQGQTVFHKPNESHRIVNSTVAVSQILTIAFLTPSKGIKDYENLIYTLRGTEKNIFANILFEGKETFFDFFNKPHLRELTKKTNQLIGSQQLLRIYLEQFLITVLRNIKVEKINQNTMKIISGKNVAYDVIDFLNTNITKKITFEDVVNHVHISKTGVKNAFSKLTGMGVMKYYNNLKIEKAKEYMAEGRYNMSQIANLLGYESIHYFSKKFKAVVGMTPTEYAKTVWPEFDKKEKGNIDE